MKIWPLARQVIQINFLADFAPRATTTKATTTTAARRLPRLITAIAALYSTRAAGVAMARRADGVVIQHDPTDPRLAAKYGLPGATDDEGFDPYADTVGPGIYGGIVRRDAETGKVIIGRQYQNHNPRPGPMYALGGYTPTSRAIHDSVAALERLLDEFPDLVDDVSTGGARPLHVCGMSRNGQLATGLLIARGADVEAVDTYGYRPLHRMASNNLAIGAEALLAAGADPNARASTDGDTPMDVAMDSEAMAVVSVLRKYGAKASSFH